MTQTDDIKRLQNEITRLREALAIIASQGGDITEPWAAQMARIALHPIHDELDAAGQ